MQREELSGNVKSLPDMLGKESLVDNGSIEGLETGGARKAIPVLLNSKAACKLRPRLEKKRKTSQSWGQNPSMGYL